MANVTKDLRIELCALLQTPRNFEVGDFVTWKHPGLAHKKLPEVGESVIVSEIFDPIRDIESPPGTQYSYEHIDMKIGIIDEVGGFIEYAADSRRLKKAD